MLVIGGYGFFGRRLVQRLAAHEGFHVIVAGRSLAAAQGLVAQLQGQPAPWRPAQAETRAATQPMAQLSAASLDAMAATFPAGLERWAPDAVVHCSGPFQGQDYRVAEACIAAGAHYIDLADGREFVAGISALDAAASAAKLLVTSGASSVPALSSAAVDHLAAGLASLQQIDIGISPGNRTERGLSTVQAILSYCGQPLPEASAAAGAPAPASAPWPTPAPGTAAKPPSAVKTGPVFGWSGAYRHLYPPPVGSRLLSPCDVPDLALLPERYPGRPRLRFGAGLELEFLHRGMNLMAWAARLGLVRNWAPHAHWLKRAADLFRQLGSDAGAMHVSVTGLDARQRSVTRAWHLVATDGDGPYVPTLAAAALLRRLAAGRLAHRGALPCVGLLSLADFQCEALGLRIVMSEQPS